MCVVCCNSGWCIARSPAHKKHFGIQPQSKTVFRLPTIPSSRPLLHLEHRPVPSGSVPSLRAAAGLGTLWNVYCQNGNRCAHEDRCWKTTWKSCFDKTMNGAIIDEAVSTRPICNMWLVFLLLLPTHRQVGAAAGLFHEASHVGTGAGCGDRHTHTNCTTWKPFFP